MQRSTQLQRAEQFRELHGRKRPLVLVNAWDAGSARVIESCGAPAIATTSAAMAWSLGYADGEQLPFGEMLAACERICRVVQVPVSVDIEHGFGATVNEVVANVRRLLALGVVGINIEDGSDPQTGQLRKAQQLVDRIAGTRAAANEVGIPLFINARTDAAFAAGVETTRRYDAILERASIYTAAGADGFFVPGMTRLDEITKLAAAISKPLNIYVGGGTPPVSELAAANIKRVSLGCGPLQAALAFTKRIAVDAMEQGTYERMTADMMSVGALNALFTDAR